MTRFLLWHKCDWCGKWSLFTFAWVYKMEPTVVGVTENRGYDEKRRTFYDGNSMQYIADVKKEYCSQICAEKKTQVLDLHGRRE